MAKFKIKAPGLPQPVRYEAPILFISDQIIDDLAYIARLPDFVEGVTIPCQDALELIHPDNANDEYGKSVLTRYKKHIDELCGKPDVNSICLLPISQKQDVITFVEEHESGHAYFNNVLCKGLNRQERDYVEKRLSSFVSKTYSKYAKMAAEAGYRPKSIGSEVFADAYAWWWSTSRPHDRRNQVCMLTFGSGKGPLPKLLKFIEGLVNDAIKLRSGSIISLIQALFGE